MSEGCEYMRVYSLIGLDNRTLSYSDFFALWLNVENTTNAQNFHSAVAGAIANGKGRLPPQWVRAAIPDDVKRAEWMNWDVFRFMDGV